MDTFILFVVSLSTVDCVRQLSLVWGVVLITYGHLRKVKHECKAEFVCKCLG